ncbi:MAG: tetratricopeptide repeat protein [Alphaproteobacteria bacterium]|nr:MAG: tetratricopeptide repeat protein [Alphaproteobacteria bacterium]
MTEQHVIQSGDLSLDPVNQRVFRDGLPLDISGLTASLFFVLHDRSPAIVPGDDLVRDVWQGVFVSEETIAQRVRLLRKALGDDAKAPRYIETVRGRGYRFIAPAVENAPRQAGRWRPVLAAALALGAAVVAVVAYGPSRAPAEMPAAQPGGATLDAPTLTRQARSYLSGHRIEDIDTAIALFEKALAVAPDDGAASLGLSFALSTRATKFSTEAGDIGRAEQLARAVLAGDSQHGQAWHALAYALDGQGRLDEALSAYLRAAELMPDDKAAASSAAYLLSIRGRLYEALKLEAATLNTAGRSRYTDIQIALDLELLGFTDASAKWLEKAQVLNPRDPVVTTAAIYAALRQQDVAGADQLFRALPEGARTAPRLKAVLADIRLAEGQPDAAYVALQGSNTILERAAAVLAGIDVHATGDGPDADDASTWPDIYLHQACLRAALGDRAGALEALSHAVDLGWRDRRLQVANVFFTDYSDDPAYAAILARMARETGSQRALVQSDAPLRAALGIE